MIKATRVQPLSNMQIDIAFNDGVQGIYTIKPTSDTSIFHRLIEPSLFAKAKVGYNGSAIVRNRSIDIDARIIYMDITQTNLYA